MLGGKSDPYNKLGGIPLVKTQRSGRNPSPKMLAEAKRLQTLYASNPANHPHAIKATHDNLRHINTCGALPDFYIDKVFTCRECGKEEIWLAEDQQWFFEVAKKHIDAQAVLCHDCRKTK